MEPSASEICTTNARAQARLGALFVDVREPVDMTALALGALEVVNLPLSKLPQRWQELPQDRELITVCLDGTKSQQAAEFLLTQGFSNVHPMRGGILLWIQKGYPVLGKRHTTLEK